MTLQNLPIGPEAPHEVTAVVEIPGGTSNKIEYDHAIEAFRLDRVLFSPLYYPCEYGFIPQTRFEDGDPLDCMVLASHATFTGCIMKVRPVGVLRLRDDKGQDDKVLSVSACDPIFSGITDLDSVFPHRLKEIEHFFAVYKELENKDVEVQGWDRADAARALVERYRLRAAR